MTDTHFFARRDIDGHATIGPTLLSLRGIRLLEGEDAASIDSAESDTDASSSDDASGVDNLGDPGKKALDSMKSKWKDADRRAKDAQTALAALQAQIDGTQQEHEQQLEAQRVRDEALSTANTRILKAEIRAQAAGKLADPRDALLHLDLSSFEVGEDGDVDAGTIASAIDDLIQSKPYLAAQGGGRFQGSGDGGARNDTTSARQLTRSDLDGMTAEQVVAARTNGQLNKLLGIRT